MNTSQTNAERREQITPFAFEDHAVRTVSIDGDPYFIAKDVCDALGIQNCRDTLAKQLPEDEKGVDTIYTPGGKQEMLVVNEPGLYRLIFQSRKPEAERFKTWVFNEVLPQIRRSGAYTAEPLSQAWGIYGLFSSCPEMTIRRINQLVYYLALRPPLSNVDIAKLTGVSEAAVRRRWRRVSGEAAREAVEALGINAAGHAAGTGERAGFPLALPAKEARDEND
jgi:prophage antirepressor-like protein